MRWRRNPLVTIDELMCLGALEALEGGAAFPDGCDSSEMTRLGLIVRMSGGEWCLTPLGRLRLKNLRVLLEFGN